MPIFPPRLRCHPHIPRDPFRTFYLITGVTVFALVSGFSVCLFDLNQISACVDYAEYALSIVRKFGDHVLAWFIAICKEIIRRNW